MVPEPQLLDPDQKEKLFNFLTDHHEAFCLDKKERGATDLMLLHIDTGDTPLKKQAIRRTRFAVREEVTRQLKKMQAMGVIQPSSSPWASPVVMVKIKDGSHRFCIDYKVLNSVPTEEEDYREEVILSMSSVRELAAKGTQKAQKRYKTKYDHKSIKKKYQVGDWVLVKFQHEETGK